MEIPVAVMNGPNRLDEMIVGVQVQRVLPNQRVRVKFLAIAGGCGPELNMPESLARDLYDGLREMFDGKGR